MLTFEELCQQHCQPQHGQPYALGEIQQQLTQLVDWKLANNQLYRKYAFNDYYETLAFVNALAYMTHREDHHPDLNVHYNFCELHYSTHSVNGITLNDFICAARAEALFNHLV